MEKNVEIDGKNVENIATEIKEASTDIVEDVVEEVEEKAEKPKKSLSKTEQARAVMKDAEVLIAAADNEVNEVQVVVAENVSALEREKSLLIDGTLSHISMLFDKVKYPYSKEEIEEPFEVSLGTTKENLAAAPITTGRFSGLLLSVLGMVGTAAGWVYVASQKTGTVLDPSTIDVAHLDKVVTDPAFEPMFTWIGGGMTGGAGNALFGMGTVVATSLLVGYTLYKMRVILRENKNVKVANKTFDKSHAYVESQKESKSEMEKIDAHIKEITPLIENYRILLEEQGAKLQRVIHIEGELEESSVYHGSSQEIMRESEQLVRRVEQLIETPVSKEGRLNEASVDALRDAKSTYESYLAKIYV